MSVPDEKFILVTRPTRLDDLVIRFNTVDQARFYVEHLGGDFADYLAEHQVYQRSIHVAAEVLSGFGRVQRVDRAFLPNFLFGDRDRVVVLGQDGLVANTMKYLGGQRVVAVNPDPNRWDGVLLPFSLRDLGRVVADELAGRRPVKMVTMAKASLNNGQTLYAVNDLFVGPRSHVSARYVIEVGGRAERQSSSGVIVSTGLGSTGWLKSIYAGWASMTDTLMPGEKRAGVDGSFAWDRIALHYFVREPFPSRSTQTSLVLGQVEGSEVLRLRSEMAENGVIFSDGVEADFLEFNSGSVATIGVAERQGMLVV